MILPRFNWIMPLSVPENIDTELSSYSSAFRSILYQRDLCTEEKVLSFLLPKEPSWYSFQQLLNIDKACLIIQAAIQTMQTE